MKKINCACGDSFKTKREFIIHVLSLGCFDENLEWKNKKPKKYIPTKEQLEKWKKVTPTEKTLKLLTDKGIKPEVIMELKTQYDAHILIEEIIKNANKQKEKEKSM